MRFIGICCLVVAVSILWAGCEPRGSAKPEGGAAPAPGGFASRLVAAKSIGNTTARDDALGQLAVDAAAGGDGETTKKAVGAIGSMEKKDQAASRAALNLAQVGKGEDANAVAMLIGSLTVRDQTLAKIAKGEFGQ
jgi:hypothetical protein